MRLPDREVSHDHAHIVRADGEHYLVDGGSTNGTRLGSRRIEPGRRHLLRTGDLIHIGPFSLLFTRDGASAETTSEETAQFARRMFRDLASLSDTDCPYLEVTSGDRSGARLRLDLRDGAAPYRVGRGPECDLVLLDPDASRVHVELARDFAGVRLRDLDSKNGLLLNGQPAHGERLLAEGDEIRIGATRLRFVDPVEARLRTLDEDPDSTIEPPPWRGERAALALAISALAACAALWLWLLAA